ncbi:MAG: EAL domain-containing protein [Kangiellaceae bacterium]|nr:EAL domain-containing protein [Kangiellaceae bacterium]
MLNKPPLPEATIQGIFENDYAAVLLCNDKFVIKAISIDKNITENSLQGIELQDWLPSELLNGQQNRAIVSLPDVHTEQEFIASITRLPKSSTHLHTLIALQPIPELGLERKNYPQHIVEDYKRTILDQAPIFIYVLDYETKLFTEGLDNYANLLGYSIQEIEDMEHGVYTVIHPDDIPLVEKQEQQLLNSYDRAVVPVEFRIRHKDGNYIWIQVHSTIYARDDNDEPLVEVGSVHKIDKDPNSRKAEKYFRTLVENSYDCILMYDKNMLVTYISPSVTRVTGYTEQDLLGKTLQGFIYEEDREDAAANLAYVAENPGALSVVERRINHKDGHVLWIESRLVNHLNDPDIKGVIINFHVITERKQSELKIHNLANFDPLTQLPNRYLFRKRLLKGLADSVKNESKLALMYIDLDRFKEINDTLGHSVGDALLQDVAKTIQKCLRASDTLARVGGDEFTIVLPETSEKEAGHIASRILEQFRTPFQADGNTVQTGASIGISIFPNHSKKAEDLFRFADIAMYSAKKERNQYQFYQLKHSEKESRRRTIEKKLKVAIANGDLRLYYQPRVDIQTGVIKSVEALCRWYDPDSGDISPGVFIPIAEETALVNELSKLVTDIACKQVVTWRNMGLDTTVALNLSIKDLKNFNIVRQFSDTMAMYDIPGESLEIEITESAAMTDVVNTVKVLNQFKELGIKLSIDDFGKGYSSLAYLSQLPVDNLKIDMYFVSQLGSQKKDRLINVNIIRSIISLAQSLDLHTVGEGIETVQQMSILKSLGCDMGQGMLYCRPLSATAITDILRQGIISFPSH